MNSDMKYSQMNKSKNNMKLSTKNDNSMSKSNSKGKNSKRNSATNSILKNKRSSMDEISSKYKSIENTYFMKEQ